MQISVTGCTVELRRPVTQLGEGEASEREVPVNFLIIFQRNGL